MIDGQQGPAGVVQGDGGAADTLGHNADVRVLLDDGKILDDLVRKGVPGIGTPGENVLQPHGVFRALGDVDAVFVENLRYAAADGSVT